MNGINYLLDTCFILEFHKKSPEVLQILIDKNIRSSECAISVINRLEALGCSHITPEDEKNLPILLSRFHKISIDFGIESKVIDLRKHHKIKLPDAIVLATALTHHLELLSPDTGLIDINKLTINNRKKPHDNPPTSHHFTVHRL